MLGVYQLAKELNVSHTTVYRWVENGLPCTYEKSGNRYALRFELEEVKEWIEKQKKSGAIRQK